MPAVFGPDENGEYSYHQMSKEEEILAELPQQNVFCNDCRRWHEFCPINCAMKHNDTHTYCRAIYARQQLEKEVHVLTPEEIMEEEEEIFTSARWTADFAKQWKFWMYQHPDSMKGDTKPAKTQNLKASAERWLQ